MYGTNCLELKKKNIFEIFFFFFLKDELILTNLNYINAHGRESQAKYEVDYWAHHVYRVLKKSQKNAYFIFIDSQILFKNYKIGHLCKMLF